MSHPSVLSSPTYITSSTDPADLLFFSSDACAQGNGCAHKTAEGKPLCTLCMHKLFEQNCLNKFNEQHDYCDLSWFIAIYCDFVIQKRKYGLNLHFWHFVLSRMMNTLIKNTIFTPFPPCSNNFSWTFRTENPKFNWNLELSQNLTQFWDRFSPEQSMDRDILVHTQFFPFEFVEEYWQEWTKLSESMRKGTYLSSFNSCFSDSYTSTSNHQYQKLNTRTTT